MEQKRSRATACEPAMMMGLGGGGQDLLQVLFDVVHQWLVNSAGVLPVDCAIEGRGMGPPPAAVMRKVAVW